MPENLIRHAETIEEQLAASDANALRQNNRRNNLIAAIAVGVFLLVVNGAYSQYRAIYVTGPRIQNTNDIAEQLNKTNENVEVLVNFVNTLVAQTCEVETPQNEEFCTAINNGG